MQRSLILLLHLTFCFLPKHKNIASAEEGPSWALNCIIQLLTRVWDLNEVYCLKTGLAAWPSCLSKSWLRYSQLWNCHDIFQSTIAQVFEPEVLSVFEAVCIDMLGFTYALCLCILSGHRWLHLVPLQNSNGLSGKRKLVHELAEPLGWIQPALEIENRAFTLLTLS